jgi:hypothetical protein
LGSNQWAVSVGSRESHKDKVKKLKNLSRGCQLSVLETGLTPPWSRNSDWNKNNSKRGLGGFWEVLDSNIQLKK